MTQTIQVFVGCDPNNCDLEQMMVLEYSLRKHTSHPVNITWMQLSHDTNSPWYTNQATGEGWRTEKWATPFSGFRWAIPESCNFEGRAIYMDADVIVLCDIAELWSHPMQDDAIVIAKGGKSSARLCTCVWDCEKAKQYLPALKDIQANPDAHKNLMRLLKEKPNLVQPYKILTIILMAKECRLNKSKFYITQIWARSSVISIHYLVLKQQAKSTGLMVKSCLTLGQI